MNHNNKIICSFTFDANIAQDKQKTPGCKRTQQHWKLKNDSNGDMTP